MAVRTYKTLVPRTDIMTLERYRKDYCDPVLFVDWGSNSGSKLGGTLIINDTKVDITRKSVKEFYQILKNLGINIKILQIDNIENILLKSALCLYDFNTHIGKKFKLFSSVVDLDKLKVTDESLIETTKLDWYVSSGFSESRTKQIGNTLLVLDSIQGDPCIYVNFKVQQQLMFSAPHFPVLHECLLSEIILPAEEANDPGI